MTINPTGPFGTLNPGNYLFAAFSFTNTAHPNEYPLICSGASIFGSNTESVILITGTAQSAVPEFPIGGFLLSTAIGLVLLMFARSVRKTNLLSAPKSLGWQLSAL